MNPIDLIKEIEEKYDIQNISCNNFPIWQYIRNLLYSQSIPTHKSSFLNRIKNIYYMIKNHRWGNISKEKSYKYLLFTDLNEQKLYNNQYIDKTAQGLVELLEEELLIIVNPCHKLHNTLKQETASYMSSSFFHYKRWILGLSKSCDIKNRPLLDIILKKYTLDLDVEYYNRLFFTYIKIFKDWLDEIKPNTVFINCSYSLFHQALIYACKKKGIKTVELQHGLISKRHIQYAPQKFIGTETFPNYILTHGEYVNSSINTNFIDANNIIPVGHYYLEQIINMNLNESKKNEDYKKTVVVSMQNDIEGALLKSIKIIASKEPKVLFLIKCRNLKNIPLELKNVQVEKDKDIYKLVKNADLHISCYSTVALEASALGTPTILININNMAKLHYSEICKDFTKIRICESEDEVIDLINHWAVDNHCDNPYRFNNKNNIKQFLNTYINNENSLHIS